MSSRVRRFPALVAVILAAGAALLSPHISSAAASSCALTTISSGNQGACWTPFASSSPFNTPLPSNPQLAADNAAVQQHMAQYGWSLGGSDSTFRFGLDGSRPVFYASASDPTMTIDCTSDEGPGTCQGSNGVDINGMQINVPAGAEPDNNWDGHFTVIETATGQEFDFWHATISGSTITSGTGAVTNVNTGDGTGGGGNAAGFALTAGLLRPSELTSGHINHALVLVVPCTDATGANVGYTYPAAGGWGEYCGEWWSEQASNAPELGQRFQLNMTAAQIAASGAPNWEQTIMTALAQYGAYIEDTQGSWHSEAMGILTQDSNSWTDLGQQDPYPQIASAAGEPGYQTLVSSVPIPVSKLQLVATCVTQATCVSSTTPVTTGPPTPTTPTSGASSTSTGAGTSATAAPPAASTGSAPATGPVTTVSGRSGHRRHADRRTRARARAHTRARTRAGTTSHARHHSRSRLG